MLCARKTALSGRAGAYPFGSHHRLSVRAFAPKRGHHGFDNGKKVKRRKRHIAVDTLGLLLVVVVHCAGIQDKDGAKLVFMKMLGKFPRLRLIWADGAYAGYLISWLSAFTDCVGSWVLEIVKRPKEAQGFVLLPRRWVHR